MKYWDIGQVLSYNRCFNFINGPRSIGKTYTTEKFCIKRALEQNQQFFYIVRTQYEKLNHAMEDGLSKVVLREFGDYEIDIDNGLCTIKEDGKRRTLGYCLAISESAKIRRKSFPLGKWLIFDEYMLAPEDSGGYINGWQEPDKFLSIYHTIDREENRLVCFMLGNNTTFYNPYHMHKAFNIPRVAPGKIWASKNVLFQYALPSDELTREKSDSEFLKMIQDTDYAKYAISGEYTDTNSSDIMQLTGECKLTFLFSYMGETFGCWRLENEGLCLISKKFDPSCPFHYALTTSDRQENTIFTKERRNAHLQFMSRAFKYARIRYDSLETKSKTEKAIIMLL